MSAEGFTYGQVVQDDTGHHFLYLRTLEDGYALIESVATRETFRAPIADLRTTDRQAF